MRHRLIYLTGAPGSGKSTLTANLTERFTRIPAISKPSRDYLFEPHAREARGVELGCRRGEFSGTDALPMNVIETAVPWLAERETPLVIAEGARLSNVRFLTAAVDAGYLVTLAFLDHEETVAWRTARSARLGKVQHPSWVAGRATAARNLADDPPSGVQVLRGHPAEVCPSLAVLIADAIS